MEVEDEINKYKRLTRTTLAWLKKNELRLDRILAKRQPWTGSTYALNEAVNWRRGYLATCLDSGLRQWAKLDDRQRAFFIGRDEHGRPTGIFNPSPRNALDLPEAGPLSHGLFYPRRSPIQCAQAQAIREKCNRLVWEIEQREGR